MNISGVSSSSSSYATQFQQMRQQRMQDFNSLASSLQSGDLTGAQTAFAAFQKDLPANSSNSPTQGQTTGPFGKNSKANADFQALSSALQENDVAGAQKAMASLKQDLKAGHVHRGHHAKNDGDADDAVNSTTDSTSSQTASSSPLDLLNVQA